MAYLIDTSVLIQAKKAHYRFNLCPGFWLWMDRQFTANHALSIKPVFDEIMEHNDELTAWTKTRRKSFRLVGDPKTEVSFGALSAWVMENHPLEAAEAFFEAADYYLVGYAMAHDHCVVSHENKRGYIKIPAACDQFGVRHISPFEMLEECKVRFVLVEPTQEK